MTRSPKQFVAEIKNINPNIKVIGTYTKAIEPVQVRCKKCGKVWSPRAYSLFQGKGCPSCSARQGAKNNNGKTGLKTTEQFIEDLKLVDGSIQVLGEYENGHTNIRLRCKRCNNEWEVKPYSVLQGHGCPRCAKSGTSFMEQVILLSFQDVLGMNNVISRDKSTIGMELDIVIPLLKIAIEPGNWFLHSNSIKRDEKKRKLCSDNGFRLITIYDRFPKDKKPPFADNIYTFTEDLNKADHSIIRNLISELFRNVGVAATIPDDKWNKIEETAYANAKAMTLAEFVERMSHINPSIRVLGNYQNVNRRLKVHCNVCGYEWNAVPASLLSGDGCRKCGTKKAHENMVKKQDIFEKEIAIVNPDIEIIGQYRGRHYPVKARCKICGLEWEPIAASLLRGSSHKGRKTMHKTFEFKK